MISFYPRGRVHTTIVKDSFHILRLAGPVSLFCTPKFRWTGSRQLHRPSVPLTPHPPPTSRLPFPSAPPRQYAHGSKSIGQCAFFYLFRPPLLSLFNKWALCFNSESPSPSPPTPPSPPPLIMVITARRQRAGAALTEPRSKTSAQRLSGVLVTGTTDGLRPPEILKAPPQ